MRRVRQFGAIAIVTALLAVTGVLWRFSNRVLVEQLLSTADIAADQFRMRFESSLRERLAALAAFPAIAALDGHDVAAAEFRAFAIRLRAQSTGFEALILVDDAGQALAVEPAHYGGTALSSEHVASWIQDAEPAWFGVRLTRIVDLPERNRGFVASVPFGQAEHGGYVIAVLSVKDVVGDLFSEALRNRLGTELIDDRGASVFRLVDADAERRFDRIYAIEKEIWIGTRRIVLTVNPYATSDAGRHNAPGWLILGLGGLLSVVIALALWEIGSRATTLERLVRERTTELELKHHELEVEHRRALEATRLKNEFLANMTHELKSPIHSILTLSGVMQDHVSGPLNAEQEKQVGFIHRSGQDLLRLIEGILTSARLEADKIEIARAPTDLAATLRAVLDSCSPLSASKNLTVDLAVEPSVPGRVGVDEEKLKLVLGNLLSNAIKFTGEGGRIEVRARARAQRDGGEGGELELEVEDSGIGIDAANHELIFEEFRQVDGSITRRFGGTGLGLSLARKLAERMDGTLTVASTLGRGATFQVRLPIDAPPRKTERVSDRGSGCEPTGSS